MKKLEETFFMKGVDLNPERTMHVWQTHIFLYVAQLTK